MKIYDEFEGVIKPTEEESTPWWPEAKHPGPDAPNIVVILIDDLGFSHFGSYGSDIETPRIDQLAAEGVRYTNFHVTPVCSPTRASLLTGRNHHSVGMRSISNFNTGYPNMRGHVSNHAATVAEVLRDEGFATFAVGKWHLCPMENASAAGPYDQWPLQRGFDRYYGFLDGETDQFHPELVYDNHFVELPKSVEDGYHLSEDLIDRSIEFIHDTKSIRPDRPFFLYLAFGATHAPHQAPAAYREKYRGRFDQGWDVERERWYQNQIDMGITSPQTKLAPRNPGVEAWADMGENDKLLAARLQEAYAGFLDHTDEQIGRLVDALAEIQEMDNTIIFLMSDNGASQEGGPFGVLHEMKFFNGILETPDEAIHRIDEIGGPHSHSNYPWGWAQAGNTPFRWYKQNTHEGGVHVPLIVRWPENIKDPGSLRTQFHHVNDIVPTIYDILGINPPDEYRGYEQMPITGTSMKYTFDAADEPSKKRVQYFEMMGHRAIYADGWKAVTRHEAGTPFADDDWELYHLAQDASECENLAEEMPEKLAELIELWWKEAEENGVLPLDDRTVQLFGARFRDQSPHPKDRHYVYRPPMSPMPAQVGASIGGRSWELTATIDRPAKTNGVLYASGTENAGLSIFIQNDRLVFDYNCFGNHQIADSTIEVPVGGSKVGVRFLRTGGTGKATLLINDQECGQVDIPLVMNIMSSVGPSVGYDHGSPVSDRYSDEFAFGGQLVTVEIQLDSQSAAEAKENAAAQARAAMAQQ